MESWKILVLSASLVLASAGVIWAYVNFYDKINVN